MTLAEAFNGNAYAFKKESPAVLWVNSGDYSSFRFDFALRVMTAYGSTGGASVTPFSQLDREMLIEMRDRFVKLGGNPPELPADPSVAPLPAARRPLVP